MALKRVKEELLDFGAQRLSSMGHNSLPQKESRPSVKPETKERSPPVPCCRNNCKNRRSFSLIPGWPRYRAIKDFHPLVSALSPRYGMSCSKPKQRNSRWSEGPFQVGRSGATMQSIEQRSCRQGEELSCNRHTGFTGGVAQSLRSSRRRVGLDVGHRPNSNSRSVQRIRRCWSI